MNIKYDLSHEDYKNLKKDPLKKNHIKSWLNNTTLDYWRHQRIRSLLIPIIKSNLNNKWLTIGDGRYGNDSTYIINQGIKNIITTDISDVFLKDALDLKIIKEYSIQNAENLSYDDLSFDYVSCKESLHHLPRPYTGLYEMYRVCKKGVIICEPRDHFIDPPIFKFILDILRIILRKKVKKHSFEEVKNYVYTFSETEIEKFFISIKGKTIAYRGINDAYIPGVEQIPLKSKNFKHKLINFYLKFRIFRLNFFNFLQLSKSNLIYVILFKDCDKDLKNKLIREGWKFVDLPSA